MNALAVSCITCVTLLCNVAFLRFLLIPRTSIVQCDWFVSSHVKKALKEQKLPKTIFSSNNYINEALFELPVLQSINVRLNRYKSLYIKARARTPWLRINHDLVLTRDAFVLPAHFFDAELTKNLSGIYATKYSIENTTYNTDLFDFLNNVPEDFLYDAHIMWHNKTYITLKTTLFPKMTIVAHHSTRFDAQLMGILTKIATDTASLKIKKSVTYADVRFKNQIIVSHKKEEAS